MKDLSLRGNTDEEVVRTMKMEAKLATTGIGMVIVGNSLSVVEALGLV